MMIYLEMSRDEQHGGGTWGFTNCIWAPTRKRNGAKWPFWEKVGNVKQGDIILHLRGVRPNAKFVGFSYVSVDGFITTRCPPDSGKWGFSDSFYRADLVDFTPFFEGINLEEILIGRRQELEQYFSQNRVNEINNKSNIFLVKQAGRLQCLNGAYLSDIDENLLTALFGDEHELVSIPSRPRCFSIETGTQLLTIHSRLGQAKFSYEIKKLYKNKCCFPDCPIDDNRFLVGSHIARWSDNENLRGNLGNGLCFCLMHDKAFEIGLFTLDEDYRIFINPKERKANTAIIQHLLPYHGKKINLASIMPLDDALLEHWIRVDIDPQKS